MRVEYTRSKGRQLTYTIEADRHGSYRILLGDKQLRHVATPQDFFGKGRYGSKRKEADAVRQAQGDIELLMGMSEE